MSLFVRTGSAGTGPSVTLADLGIIVAPGATFIELTSGTATSPEDGYGQFTAIEIRDSVYLYEAIKDGTLEASSDGITNNISAVNYNPDITLLGQFVDDTVTFAGVNTTTLFVDGYNFTGHLNGGANKHDASEIDVEGAYTYIPGTPTNLEATIAAIDTALSTAAGFAFSNVAGDTGTAVADTASDTITIVGANSIVTSANAGTDTLTIDGYALLPRDGTRPMTGNLDLNGNKIVNLGTPTLANDAATKAYVDGVAAGLDVKTSVRAATTANIALSGAQTVDGVVLIAGNRVLVKDQTNGSENGIYVVAAGAWSRSTDADNSPSGEVTSGMFTFIEEGTTYSDSGWVLATDDPIVLDTTSLVFTQFTGAGQIIAGTGLTKTGNQLDVGGTANRITVNADTVDISATYVGQASITTLGTITTGVWTATDIAVADGGTGSSTAAGARSNLSAAPNSAKFLMVTTDAELTDDRVATQGTAITFTDAGTDGGAFTIAHAQVASGDLHTEYLKADGTRALTGDLSAGGNKITSLATPTADNDAANKAYVDGVAQGLDFKQSVRAATAANITLSGTQTIDGVALSVGNRVLVKDQTNGYENGIYIVSAGAWTRSTDADSNPEVTAGMFLFVAEGTLYADTGWVLATDDPIVLNTTSLLFVQFSSAGQVIAGAGLTKTGNTLDAVGTANRIDVFADNIDIASTYAGQASITTLGTITTGVWTGTDIAVADGGTGSSTAIGARANLSAAPNDPTFLTLSLNGELTNERVLTAGTAINFVDGYANGALTVNHSQVASGDLHTEYIKADGTRALTGDWAVNAVVTFSPSVSTDPSLVIVPDSSAPTTGLVNGAICIVAGIMYVYDTTRSKWLSVDRKTIEAGKLGKTNNVYLRSYDAIPTSATGYRAIRNGTIVGMTAQTDTSATWILEVRRNDIVTPISTLTISGAIGNQTSLTNVDFSVGDQIQIYANTSGVDIMSPVVGIELAWRI